MNRDELVEVGAQAIAAQYVPTADIEDRLREDVGVVVDAVEPLIRADEQDQMLSRMGVPGGIRNLVLADLRANVEALRDKWRRSVERDPDGKLSGYDRAHVGALNDVLDLIDGGSDG
jgi:hypothetical protein